MDGGRAFPQAIDAERALLGGLLQRPDLLGDVFEVLKPGEFYRPEHRDLYALLHEMSSAGEPIDMVSVPMRVEKAEHPERYGGLAYVAELPDYAPSTANLTYYAQQIRQRATLRGVITQAHELADAAYAQPDDVGALIDRATQSFMALGDAGAGDTWHPISRIIDEELVRLEGMEAQGDGITGVGTGFHKLDKMLAGLQKGDLVILAARPSMGKTAFALNIAQHAAVYGGVGVGIYSLEMGREQLVDRMLCAHAMVDATRLRTGRLDADDWNKLLEASEQLRLAPLYINDRPGLTVGEVRAHARKLKSTVPNLGFIMLDYLQLMGSDDPRQSRVQQVSDMSRGLKALAKDLGLPVMALSQLSRGVEQRQDKRPLMSDLRESGAIEQDADVVMFIYRDEYYNDDTQDVGLAEVIIGKQRNGPTGMVKLVFQGQFTRFDNYEADHDLL